MSNIFINGLKSKTGGGKTILNNYLTLLKKSNSHNKYIVLTPDKDEYEKYSCNHIKIVDIKKIYKKNVFFPFLYFIAMPGLLKNFDIDLIFNLGDIPIPTRIPQLYLFDWSYAVYPDSVVWRRTDWNSFLNRKIKLMVFKRYIKYATVIMAQTATMQTKLENLFGLRNVEIVPMAVSLENIEGGESFDFDFPKNKIKLLFLTHYYPHKNLEIFIPLAKEIKRKRLDFMIIITIHKSQHIGAKKVLGDIKRFGLEDVIYNIGPVSMKHVPALYKQCDGLLMPTLLESFSSTYVEAMFHKLPIFTSDIDFAKDVCGDGAFYFDPLSVNSILNSICQAFRDEESRRGKIREGQKRLSQFLSWEEVFKKYNELLDVLSRREKHNIDNGNIVL